MLWKGTCVAGLHIPCRPQVECCDTGSLIVVPITSWGHGMATVV